MRKESLRHASLPCSPLDCENDEYSYRVESTGAVVNLRSSVSLLYLYCSKLPSDRLVSCIYLQFFGNSKCFQYLF